MIHNFKDSLAASHKAEDLLFWEVVYKKAFPSMVAMVNHRQDGDHQRQGIDRSITLENSKQILIDEKVRFTAYNPPDILLEEISDSQRNTPGWACKPLLADYIAYAVAPTGVCYLLPVIQLQSAWAKNKIEWMKCYKRCIAKNKTGNNYWETISYAIPVKTVFYSIGQMLRISFDPYCS